MRYTIVKLLGEQREYFSRGGQFAKDNKNAISFAFPPINYLAHLRYRSSDKMVAIGNIGTENEVILG